jgi:hypothetical protein
MMKFSRAISRVKWLSGEKHSKQKPEPKNNKPAGIAVLPHQQAVSNKISRLLTKYNIKTVHIPKKKNRQLLRAAKDDLGLKIPGVYRIPCECGKVYIGQTGRSVEARCKEHMRHTARSAGEICGCGTQHQHRTQDRFQQRLSVGQSIWMHGPPRQGSHPNKTQSQKLQQGQWLHTEPDLEPRN